MSNINPIKIFQKDNVKEEYYVFSGYVKSVTDQGTYNSVSFKVNSDDCGIDAPLVSVRCFAQTIGVNHKKLVENLNQKEQTESEIKALEDKLEKLA